MQELTTAQYKHWLRSRSLRIVSKANASASTVGLLMTLRDALKEEGIRVANR